MPIAIGVPPVAPQRQAGETENVQRRTSTTESGGFRPQTNVALKTAIEDLAGTLSKISSQEKFGIDKLPADIGQVVRNILQQSLSVNQTISLGIGSTIESQRFSNDQLMILARMLAQIGALAEKGFSMELSDETKTLLTQFKNLIVSESGGTVLEPVLMSKSAFELIDNKNPEQLPQALYEILAQLAQPATLTTNQPQQSEGFQFLNQLVKFFMPRPTSTESQPQQQTQQQPQNQQTQQRPQPTATQRLLNSMYRQLDDPYAKLQKQQAAQNQPQNLQQNSQSQNQPQNLQQNSQSQNQPQNLQQNSQSQNQPQNLQQNSQSQNQPQNLQQNSQSQNQPQNLQQNSQSQNQPQNLQQNSQSQNQPQNLQQNSQSQNQPQNLQQNSQSQNQPQNLQQNSQSQNQPQNLQQNSQTQNQTQNPFLREGSPELDENFISKQQDLKNQMQFSKNILLKQPMQNTPQTMETMKNLAQFLMKNSQTITPRDAVLLQNFVNNSQQMLPEDEARHLQNLLRLCQQNVPAVVQQAAVQHKLPDLPRLWAFMQLCDMASLSSKMTPRGFKRAGRDVSDFANILRNVTGSDNSTVQNQRSFQMMIPIYLGGNETSYPTYLSIYDENTKDKDTGVEKKETWLRICVLTDNIGAAELIFRVYEGDQLDMRFYFSEIDVAQDFKNYISDLRGAIRDTNFKIGEIRIGSIGERMLAS